jgi:hypothetical protein
MAHASNSEGGKKKCCCRCGGFRSLPVTEDDDRFGDMLLAQMLKVNGSEWEFYLLLKSVVLIQSKFCNNLFNLISKEKSQ